ncbi:hypothetical protein G9A89_005801 [Geosiphon pyriformis]|nr:hypothetical protein G9A89_005801 [Geosiphon pyriformis]
MMHPISLSELLLVISGLPDGKAAGLSDIPNKLWNHSGNAVIGCLLRLLNMCLNVSGVPVLWKRTWVSMIPKPYDWDGVLMNTCPIVLIETSRKILFKILSDCISFACSKFGVLWVDNFSVLKSTSIQSSVFAVESIVEDALKKNREIWLVLQDMVITDFGLSDSYRVYDGLDQGKVFSPLLWRIFYDSLLCEIKRHEHLCEYWIDTKFVSKLERIENCNEITSYFVASVFVDDIIWVGSCQTSIQYVLNIASEFFEINDISINNNKTVAILINQDVKVASLNICGQLILIAKKDEVHCYLGIFLSTERLSKPSVAKAHSDVCFFVNVVLKKTIIDKQFSYLVSAVLQPIISYWI